MLFGKVFLLLSVLADCCLSLQPSTFGGFIAGAGQLSNSIKETSVWKRIYGLSLRRQAPDPFFSALPSRAMNAVQDFVGQLRNEERLIIATKNGAIRGRMVPFKSGIPGHYYSFQGIRYGQAPIGDRRFKAPLPEKHWKGVRPAVREGSSCPHRNMILENYKGSEDCLFLNVYTPKLPGDLTGNPNLDVMVWIHGGAFQFGSGNAFLYGPDYLIPENVIVVTLNYRLGALGFLNAGNKEAPGNAGLKDQVLALRWVKDNIEDFGGNPDSVTIFGQSAGAASVHLLILSPITKGLFQRAIAQSGVAISPWAYTENTTKRALQLGRVLGFETNDTKKLVEHLRSIPVQMIVDFAPKTLTEDDARNNIGLAFVPSVENDFSSPNSLDKPFLTENPGDILRKGNYVKIPYLLGFNSHEAMLFLRRLKKDPKLLETYENDFIRLVPNDLNITQGRFSGEAGLLADKIRNFYLGSRPISGDTIEEMIDLLTDEMFIHGIINTAVMHSKSNDTNTYLYRFAYDGSLGIYKRILAVNRPGTCHGDELGYMFYFGILNVNLDPNSSESLVQRRMVKMWTNFAKYGNPTPINDPMNDILGVKWDPVKPNKNNDVAYLDITARLEQRQNPVTERMEFWNNIYKKYNHDII